MVGRGGKFKGEDFIRPGRLKLFVGVVIVADKDFIETFSRQKKAFLRKFSREADKQKSDSSPAVEHKKVLDWFESWLKGEAEAVSGKRERARERLKERVKEREQGALSFEQFVDMVLEQTKELLAERDIEINYSLPGQSLGISESWKCVKVFGNNDIYYRIGRTRPRKGPRKGEELLVLDLVMDGYKKQVFVPLLDRKEIIEENIGSDLERELPKVEATGKYRFKMLLPFDLVEKGDVKETAKKFVDFISATKHHLNELGVN
ncbi:hypothetical protein DCCM_4504 [Desulfocucumis palustris]|uniref:Uncharacterized protein n=1 Tax=Desulfocucumis palustris TaxID=1898651 RepID=A0A2L2XN50_9FIRM|nr:hypothetical protein DCCM_4504 [Desulfocucumis palustris]